jgi:hypothetical protein
MIEIERKLPERLFYGSHEPDGEMCVMEAVAYVAGEPWSDHPSCACPVLTSYCVTLNDRMPDEQLQRLLPYVVRLVGTRATSEVELKRAYVAADFAVRVFAPMALDAVGLNQEATHLRSLPKIHDQPSARAAAKAADQSLLCLDAMLAVTA